MKHLYKDVKNIVHACDSEQMVPNNPDTYLVWTKCDKDVPANQSFKGADEVTCAECKATI